MTDAPNTGIEIAKIITGFLSENSFTIFLIVLLFICRKALSNFISRLTSLSFKNGDSELGMNAATPINESERTIVDLPHADEKPAEQNQESEIEDSTKQERWFSDMYTALNCGQLEAAETAFKRYALEEKNEVKLEENKAVYLFLKFEKGKDNSSIDALENLARTAKTEESKLYILTFLSLCLSDSMQYKKEVRLWEKASIELKSQPLVTKAIVYLAYALNKDNQSIKAKELLRNHLSTAEDNEQKSKIFEALSKTEESLGNKEISIYCKDKSLEFSPLNRDELFNSAYSASNEGIDDISISNYLRLIKIDSENSITLNNLGVRAQEAGLNIMAVESYKKSSHHKNTLAMANQGYLLLDAGFIEEAEEIAKNALELEDTHINIHTLITAINKNKEEQKNKWQKLCQKSQKRQKLLRTYIEQYYLGNPQKLEGEWLVKGSFLTEITVNNDKLEASWEEPASALGGSTYTVILTGIVSGSSFSGQYSRNKDGDRTKGLLGLDGNTENNCIGFISDDGDELNFISPRVNDDFSLSLSRKKT